MNFKTFDETLKYVRQEIKKNRKREAEREDKRIGNEELYPHIGFKKAKH